MRGCYFILGIVGIVFTTAVAMAQSGYPRFSGSVAPVQYTSPPAQGLPPTQLPGMMPQAGAPLTQPKVLPINLATALQLANARPLDIQIAERQVGLAAKRLDQARLLWVPNLSVGGNYFRHEGGQQNFPGEILQSSRGTTMLGVGPNLIVSATDAIYAPLAAKQDLRARMAQRQAIENDSALAVAEAYFTVQQARGELAGAMLAAQRAEETSATVAKLAEGLAPPLEASRARIELARRQQAVVTAQERWKLASADLARWLRLEPGTLIDPLEPASLTVTLIDQSQTLDALVVIALSTRPELAGGQAVVQAALTRLKQEKMRPLIPSLALRSASTNPSGSLGYGGFGGGANDRIANWGSRFDIDVQILWEFSALGFGNRVRVGERRLEHQQATLELFRLQDRIAAEVSQAYAQVIAAEERIRLTEPALKDALDLVEKSVLGMTQTRRVGEFMTLIVRPQEVVAAIQSLGTANADYHAAVADYNRAQFRLYRALGHPAQVLATEAGPIPAASTIPVHQHRQVGPRVSGTHVPPSLNVSVYPQPSAATPVRVREPKHPFTQPVPYRLPEPALMPSLPVHTGQRAPALPIQEVPQIEPQSSTTRNWPPVVQQVLLQSPVNHANDLPLPQDPPRELPTRSPGSADEPATLPPFRSVPLQPIAQTPAPAPAPRRSDDLPPATQPTIPPPPNPVPTITPPKEAPITWNTVKN